MNMQALLKQAQKMQKDLGKAEEELRHKEYTASTGGGAIQVTVKGTMELTAISIQDEMLQAEAKEDLQELLVHTINDALQQAITDKENRMKQMTGGVKMPGGF